MSKQKVPVVKFLVTVHYGTQNWLLTSPHSASTLEWIFFHRINCFESYNVKVGHYKTGHSCEVTLVSQKLNVFCVCVYTRSHVCTPHMEARRKAGCPLSVLYTFVEARSLSCPNLLSRLGWLAREPQESPAPSPQHWDHKHTPPGLAFLMGVPGLTLRSSCSHMTFHHFLPKTWFQYHLYPLAMEANPHTFYL